MKSSKQINKFYTSGMNKLLITTFTKISNPSQLLDKPYSAQRPANMDCFISSETHLATSIVLY